MKFTPTSKPPKRANYVQTMVDDATRAKLEEMAGSVEPKLSMSALLLQMVEHCLREEFAPEEEAACDGN